MNLEKTVETDYSVDRDTGALINHNRSAYQSYLAARKKSMEMNTLKDEVGELKSKINNMENLLVQILQKMDDK